MTATPRLTASSIAPVTFPASEQEMRMASAPSFTACWMRCACTWPSSCGGVSQRTSTLMWCCCESSFAAASAPVREARKTGLVELFAISAMVIPSSVARPTLRCASRPPPPPPPPQAPPATIVARAASPHTVRIVIAVSWFGSSRGSPWRVRHPAQPPSGEAGAPLIHDHRDDDGAPDNDPLVILVEVQRADRLADEDDQQRAQHGAQRAPLPADQARAPDHRRGDHVQLITLRVPRGGRSVEARPQERREAGRQSRHGEDADLDAGERQSREAARLEVPAEREDVPSHHGAVEVDTAQDRQGQH